MDAVNDEMLEAWFSNHRGSLDELSEQDLTDVALWFPLIGVPANDGLIGALHYRDLVV